jgi:cysteine sulfinate desulfinase/cysteine desulfurase-like protein
MKYSEQRNYRDAIVAEVEKTINNLDINNKKESSLKKILNIIFKKIKLYMSYLKLK